uniref:Uncharacterized protein n=1 Tax=Seriola lalandi dorsalis TaxID=1841481 RepID=A0A3B4WJE7_SERLL
VQREQRDARHLHNLEPHAGNVTDGVALPAETRDQHLIVLIDEVEATVPRHKRGDLLAVFDQLSAHALPDSGVGLLGLDANLLEDNALAVGGAAKGVALELRAEVRLLVPLLGPALCPPHGAQLATSLLQLPT